MIHAQEPQEIYEEIGRLIWSIFPSDGVEAYFYAKLFEISTEDSFDWIDINGDKVWYEFENSPDEIALEVVQQLKILQQHTIFEKDPWTHCKVTVTDEGRLTIDFAYIPNEDSWPGLYMRGVSELTPEEADGYSIPYEDWERMQKK